MKIAIFGATGMIGGEIVQEALRRGHRLVLVSRRPERIPVPNVDGQARTVRGDALKPDDVAEAAAGCDAIISAIGPGQGPEAETPSIVIDAAFSLLDGARRSGARRLVVVSGAGSLEAQPGLPLMETPEFPPELHAIAVAHGEALEVYRRVAPDDVAWTAVSPPARIVPGERTGRYRIGHDRLLTDDAGRSEISTADYAIAVLDEVERAEHIGERITVGY